MRALLENKTWEVVDFPQGKKIVGCKWILSVEFKPDGEIKRYKAKLVAQGYTQTYGIDYEETFTLVAKMISIKVLLSLV